MQASDAYAPDMEASTLRGTPNADGDDVRRRQFLKTAADASAVAGASILVAGRTQTLTKATASPTSGSPDTEMIREMTQVFRRLDNRYGGGHRRGSFSESERRTKTT